MRVIAVQGLGGHTFERDLRQTLSREMPPEAEVHVVVKPESCEVETRVILDGSSATRTISFRDLGDLHQQRILEMVENLLSCC